MARKIIDSNVSGMLKSYANEYMLLSSIGAKDLYVEEYDSVNMPVLKNINRSSVASMFSDLYHSSKFKDNSKSLSINGNKFFNENPEVIRLLKSLIASHVSESDNYATVVFGIVEDIVRFFEDRIPINFTLCEDMSSLSDDDRTKAFIMKDFYEAVTPIFDSLGIEYNAIDWKKKTKKKKAEKVETSSNSFEDFSRKMLG